MLAVVGTVETQFKFLILRKRELRPKKRPHLGLLRGRQDQNQAFWVPLQDALSSPDLTLYLETGSDLRKCGQVISQLRLRLPSKIVSSFLEGRTVFCSLLYYLL